MEKEKTLFHLLFRKLQYEANHLTLFFFHFVDHPQFSSLFGMLLIYFANNFFLFLVKEQTKFS